MVLVSECNFGGDCSSFVIQRAFRNYGRSYFYIPSIKPDMLRGPYELGDIRRGTVVQMILGDYILDDIYDWFF